MIQPIFWAFWAEKSRRARVWTGDGIAVGFSTAYLLGPPPGGRSSSVCRGGPYWRAGLKSFGSNKNLASESVKRCNVHISLGFFWRPRLHKFAILFLLSKRKTRMYGITYINISCSRIVPDEMVRFLEKTKVSERQKSGYVGRKKGWGLAQWMRRALETGCTVLRMHSTPLNHAPKMV